MFFRSGEVKMVEMLIFQPGCLGFLVVWYIVFNR